MIPVEELKTSARVVRLQVTDMNNDIAGKKAEIEALKQKVEHLAESEQIIKDLIDGAAKEAAK